MNKLARNERAKLSAAYVNGIAIAVAATGVLGPLASQLIGTSAPAGPLQLLVFAASCASLSAGLHYIARLFLKGLQE
ncbi:MAG TPA: amino acid transporter [Devosia sp.]|nr:amino acid transporter [Devosia sp.]